jgi:flagellar assembly protein FliH
MALAAGPARFVVPSLDAVARVDPRVAVNDRYEEARRAGFEQGYTDGLAHAEAEVAAAIADHRSAHRRCTQAAGALEAAGRDLAGRDALALAAIEDDVVQLALALATEIVGRELRSTPQPVRDAIQRALGLAPDRGTAVCHVHPDDAEVAHTVLAGDAMRREHVEIVPDGRVEPGGCVVQVGECRIDAQIGTALDRMRRALS